MKYITFTDENNDFEEILIDPNIKKWLAIKIFWKNHLKIGIPESHQKMISYIELKYGNSVITNVCRDFSPVPGIDYLPNKPEDYIG